MKRIEDHLGRFLTRASVCQRSIATKAIWVVAMVAVTSAVRWMMDPYLGAELPFFLYLPAVLLASALCGFGAGMATLLSALLVTVLLWIPPEGSWWRISPTGALSLAIWFIISGVLVYAIDLLQHAAISRRKLVAELKQKSELLEDRSRRLEASEQELAAHARNLSREVAERTARLEETIVELESFSYTVSHDLRSPLRAMQGFAHILLEDYAAQLDEQGRDYLQRIERAARRLDALILDVLRFSSIGRAPLVLRPTDLEATIEQIVAQYPQIRHAREGIAIHRPLPRVVAAESCLVPALSNLLLNAIKFTRPGTRPEIHIRAEVRGASARLHIVDRGIGIAPASRPQIFAPFQRGREAEGYEGNGIGLAIVKRAMKRQGGDVGVESHAGQGSDFWIELPLAPDGPVR